MKVIIIGDDDLYKVIEAYSPVEYAAERWGDYTLAWLIDGAEKCKAADRHDLSLIKRADTPGLTIREFFQSPRDNRKTTRAALDLLCVIDGGDTRLAEVLRG